MDYSRNQRYFKPRPRLKWPLIFLLVGILTSAVGLFLVGLPLAIIAVLWLFVAFGGRPVDAEMDAAASSLMGDFRQRAFNKLGVEEEEIALADPIEFWGWDFDARLDDEKNLSAQYVRGKDNVWRSSEVFIGGFYFSEDVVHYYYKIVSLVSDATIEGTEEYFYKDIVSVKTESKNVAKRDPRTGVEDPKVRMRYETFVLRNSGGESTVCSVRDPKTAEAAVAAFRSLLKQKKLADKR